MSEATLRLCRYCPRHSDEIKFATKTTCMPCYKRMYWASRCEESNCSRFIVRAGAHVEACPVHGFEDVMGQMKCRNQGSVRVLLVDRETGWVRLIYKSVNVRVFGPNVDTRARRAMTPCRNLMVRVEREAFFRGQVQWAEAIYGVDDPQNLLAHYPVKAILNFAVNQGRSGHMFLPKPWYEALAPLVETFDGAVTKHGATQAWGSSPEAANRRWVRLLSRLRAAGIPHTVEREKRGRLNVLSWDPKTWQVLVNYLSQLLYMKEHKVRWL